MKQTLHGIATISLWADKHMEAVEWYSNLFETQPYFAQPGYAEFRVGDHEIEVGIIDRAYAPKQVGAGVGGIIAYWHVDEVEATLKQLLQQGASVMEPAKDRGNGFVTASVVDPFGNILGLMKNPHYAEVTR